LDIECLDDISVELPVLEEATCSATPDDHFVFEEGENGISDKLFPLNLSDRFMSCIIINFATSTTPDSW
jgi:hypothetical protein